MRRFLPVLVAATIAASATACGPSHPDSAAPHGASTASKAPPTVNDPPTNVSFSGVSNGRSYIAVAATNDGATPDEHGQWHIHTGQLTGQHSDSDPAVIAAFNTASNDSAQGLLDHARADAHPASWDWTFDVKPSVTFRPTTIAELLVGVYNAAKAAHPVNYVSTIVIDSRTARPITLKALFSNESRGLQRLSEQTKLIWPTVYGHGANESMPGEPGNQPREENFANWIPTATGMEIHFADYQFGHGLPVITIPWTALADVLAPDMTALLNP
jgi:hypothetical protein